MFYVYFLKSQKNQNFYIGVTKNIETRLKKHNNGSTKSTKPYRPWKLVHFEKFNSKQEAYKREFFLKKPQGYKDKLDIISKLK